MIGTSDDQSEVYAVITSLQVLTDKVRRQSPSLDLSSQLLKVADVRIRLLSQASYHSFGWDDVTVKHAQQLNGTDSKLLPQLNDVRVGSDA